MMDLSHSVDGVVQHNLKGLKNVDVIQCSINAPPIRDRSVDGIVYCHNVIQHTPSVEKTAASLWAITGPGGEFVFNCYGLNDSTSLRWIRHHFIYKPLRSFLSKMPFSVIMGYARIMGILRLVPGLGIFLEKAGFCVRGEVPKIAGESYLRRVQRCFQSTCLNTFDGFGSHHYQHHKSDAEIRTLVDLLQPDPRKVLNMEQYFTRPQPIGIALRLFR